MLTRYAASWDRWQKTKEKSASLVVVGGSSNKMTTAGYKHSSTTNPNYPERKNLQQSLRAILHQVQNCEFEQTHKFVPGLKLSALSDTDSAN